MNDDTTRHEDDELLERLHELMRDAPLHDHGEDEDENEDTLSAQSAQIDALLLGDMSPSEAADFAQRLPDDPQLALAVRVAVSMRESIEIQAAQSESPKTTAAKNNVVSLRTWAWVGLAAAVAAAAVLWLNRGPRLQTTHDEQIRATDAPSVRSTVNLTSLPRDAFILTWNGGPLESTYDVYVTTDDLVPIDHALDLSVPRHQVPRSLLVDRPLGTRVLWRVVARSPDGRELASPTFEVTLQ